MNNTNSGFAELVKLGIGPVSDTKRSTNVREFVPMPILPKPEFVSDPEFPQYVGGSK